MRWRNQAQGYGAMSIGLHWLGALGVLSLFGLGLYMVQLTYYDPGYHRSLSWHKSLGICIALLWLWRLAWRFMSRQPAPVPMPSWQQHVSRGVHGILYLLPLLLFVTGYLISTAKGDPIAVWGWVEVPAIEVPVLATLDLPSDWAGDLHRWLAWGLIGLVVLHAMAALKHHWIDRDATLRRMLKPRL